MHCYSRAEGAGGRCVCVCAGVHKVPTLERVFGNCTKAFGVSRREQNSLCWFQRVRKGRRQGFLAQNSCRISSSRVPSTDFLVFLPWNAPSPFLRLQRGKGFQMSRGPVSLTLRTAVAEFRARSWRHRFKSSLCLAG